METKLKNKDLFALSYNDKIILIKQLYNVYTKNNNNYIVYKNKELHLTDLNLTIVLLNNLNLLQ